MEQKQVTIYTTPTCHFCHMSKEYFKANGVTYTEFDVANDIAKREEMMQKSGQRGVPVIFIGDEMIIGFDKQAIDKALNLTAASTTPAQ